MRWRADPKVEVTYAGRLRRVSGACRWVSNRFIIKINKREPVVRQRFTVLHELKKPSPAPPSGDLETAQPSGQREAL